MKRAKITEELAYGTALDRLTGVVVEPQEEEAKPEAPPEVMIKLSVFLRKDEDAYLEGLAATAKFTGGKKLSKTKLVEAMVRAFRSTSLDVRGVRTEEELARRVVAQVRNNESVETPL